MEEIEVMDEDEHGDDKGTGKGKVVDCLGSYNLSSAQSKTLLLPVPVFRGPADSSLVDFTIIR